MVETHYAVVPCSLLQNNVRFASVNPKLVRGKSNLN